MANNIERSWKRRGSFAQFFESWEEQHRIFLDKLEEAQAQYDLLQSDAAAQVQDDELLVQQVLCHYQEYYDEKSKAAESDVFLMFSPPWFSSYERTLLWVTGFKPSAAFVLAKESVGGDLNQDQKERIAAVKQETRRMEGQIAQAMASVQEGVAGPTFCGCFTKSECNGDGAGAGSCLELENAMEGLKLGLLEVMRDADALRQRTALQVLEVLTMPQKLKFLAGTSQFWLQCRRLGMDRDGRNKLSL